MTAITITAAITTFTVGIVGYMLRAGSLFAGLMSNLPLWRGFDPISILFGDNKRQKDRNETASTNETKSGTLFKGEEK